VKFGEIVECGVHLSKRKILKVRKNVKPSPSNKCARRLTNNNNF
jgi:hypothetical protein